LEASPPRVTNAMNISSQSSSAQVLTKSISLNPSLDFSQINQTSLRGVGERSQKAQGCVFSSVAPQALKGGKGEAFTLSHKN
jgi:hypothetical protein